MDEREFTLNGSSFAAGLMRLSNRIISFRRISRICENRNCEQRGVLWPFWLRSCEGIRLHGRWYCGPKCFECAARDELLRLFPAPETRRKKAHRIPIGLLLLSRGMINNAQLKQALMLQREKGAGKIGKFLQDIRAVTEQDITAGLAAQWGCPVYPLDGARDFLQYASLLPLTLLEAGRMLPVRYVRLQQTLYLAFVEGIDRTALYAVEQMLHVRTIPCIVSESAHTGAMEELRHVESLQTTVFESPFEPDEMAHTMRSYALQIGAKDVWIVRSGRFIWVRLQNLEGPKDILFQSLAGV
jgi:hypothetical protein